MSTIVSICGFCEARDQTFDVVSHEMRSTDIVIGAKCRRCRKISSLLARSPVNVLSAARDALAKNDDATSAIQVTERVPLVREHKAPAHVPDEVARAFVQAEKLSATDEMSEPAAVMYGRTVETALTAASQRRGLALVGGTLVKRIDDAAAKQLIPNDLAEWAHEVRQLRNDGAHVGAVDHAEVLELQGFVELLLRYLFTLPGIMAERRLKKTPTTQPTTSTAA